MPRQLKLLFDENFGGPLVDALGRLLGFHESKPDVKHVRDMYAQGSADDEWIPAAADGGFVIITCDRGKRYGGPKLPEVCRKHRITHVLVSGKLHSRKQFEKARAIIAVWPDLAKILDSPRGARFVLRMVDADHFKLEPRDQQTDRKCETE